MPSSPVRILTLGAAFVLGTTGCSENPPRPTERNPVPAQNAAGTRGLPTDATALPSVDAAGLSDVLASLRGTPVVLNIWGSWCGPCRQEAPHLAAAHRRWGDRVQFLGLDILDTRESARAFIRRFGWTYPSFFDPSGTGEVRTALGYLGQPVTILYDARGRKVVDWEGPVSPDFLERNIRAILSSTTAPDRSPSRAPPVLPRPSGSDRLLASWP